MVIGVRTHCGFCGRVHYMGDARGPEWCLLGQEHDRLLESTAIARVLPPVPEEGYDWVESRPFLPNELLEEELDACFPFEGNIAIFAK